MSRVDLKIIKKDRLDRLKGNSNGCNFYELIIPKDMGMTIFIKERCQYSQRAMQELKNKGIKFISYDIDDELGGRETCTVNNMYRFLEMSHGLSRYTVPQVFYGKKYIGGCDQLLMYLKKH